MSREKDLCSHSKMDLWLFPFQYRVQDIVKVFKSYDQMKRFSKPLEASIIVRPDKFYSL